MKIVRTSYLLREYTESGLKNVLLPDRTKRNDTNLIAELYTMLSELELCSKKTALFSPGQDVRFV